MHQKSGSGTPPPKRPRRADATSSLDCRDQKGFRAEGSHINPFYTLNLLPSPFFSTTFCSFLVEWHEDMRPFVRLRSILLASKKCRPLALHSHPPSPSAPQLYTTKSETVNTSARAKEQNGAEIEDDIDSFDLGFDDWTEVDPKTKTIETAVGSLPISPLLDPTWREARQRKKEKLLPNRSKFNRFQRRVEESPYGQSLRHREQLCGKDWLLTLQQ